VQENTFHDFLAVARHLVEAGYTSRAGLAVWGRSAGGLTLGASLNMDPGVSAAEQMQAVSRLGLAPLLRLEVRRSQWVLVGDCKGALQGRTPAGNEQLLGVDQLVA
jgi:hypothetical protein